MIRVIIVDNEVQAQETMANLIAQYCTDLQIAGCAAAIDEAKALITQIEPHLVFLDVELNNESGFDLFKYFPAPNFEVIFTTAHQEYALRAIKYSCLDYLLKPIDFRELQQAVSKSENRPTRTWQNKIENLVYNLQQKAGVHKIAIPYCDGYDFVPVNDIIMALAEGNYTRIFTVEGQLLSSRTLGEFESLLKDPQFFRSHKSYLINWQHLDRYNKSENLIYLKNGIKAELANRRKEEFLKRIRDRA